MCDQNGKNTVYICVKSFFSCKNKGKFKNYQRKKKHLKEEKYEKFNIL